MRSSKVLRRVLATVLAMVIGVGIMTGVASAYEGDKDGSKTGTEVVNISADGDKPRLWTDKPFEIFLYELARRGIHPNRPNRHPTLDCQPPPRVDVRMMVQLSHDDLVAD